MPVLFTDFLATPWPNPFNPTVTIRYGIKKPGHVKLVVYNAAGQRVATLVDEAQQAGGYTITWDGTNDRGQMLASGVYFHRIVAGDFVDTGEMVLLK